MQQQKVYYMSGSRALGIISAGEGEVGDLKIQPATEGSSL